MEFNIKINNTMETALIAFAICFQISLPKNTFSTHTCYKKITPLTQIVILGKLLRIDQAQVTENKLEVKILILISTQTLGFLFCFVLFICFTGLRNLTTIPF